MCQKGHCTSMCIILASNTLCTVKSYKAEDKKHTKTYRLFFSYKHYKYQISFLINTKKGGKKKSSKCQNPFYDTLQSNILHVSRLPINTSMWPLKCDYITIQPKTRLSSSFLVLSPQVVSSLPSSFRFSLTLQPKTRQKLFYFSGRFLLESTDKLTA